MSPDEPLRVGYVVKRYPRYSETFIVREILAHEAAGLEIDIFALRPPSDTHFQDPIARVRAPVHYLPSEEHVRASDFWAAIEASAEVLPALWTGLREARGLEVRDVYQAIVLAREAHQRGISHLHAPFASDPATVARLASSFARVPYSFTARAKDIFHKTVQSEQLRRKLREAGAVITVSNYNLDWLRKTYGAAASHVQRIYNGLDLEQFPYEAPYERPPRIVSVGRFVEKKGFGDLVDACAILVARGRSFTCQIIGTGLLEAELRARIARLLTDPGLRVRLATSAWRLIESEFDIHQNAARRRAIFRQADRVGIEAA